MTTFVLIHGAWHYGALWGEVAKPLRDAGHTVHTPTLAGNGPGEDVVRTVGHADAVASAVNYVLGEDLTDFILLGHSYGGTIVSRMAEEVPDRIRRLIYWNAFVLEDGESIETVSPPHYKGLMDSIVASGAYGPGVVKLPFPVWREAFMNDADLALAEKTYEMTTPHPLRTLTDPVSLKSFPDLQIPRSYLNCTEDRLPRHTRSRRTLKGGCRRRQRYPPDTGPPADSSSLSENAAIRPTSAGSSRPHATHSLRPAGHSPGRRSSPALRPAGGAADRGQALAHGPRRHRAQVEHRDAVGLGDTDSHARAALNANLASLRV